MGQHSDTPVFDAVERVGFLFTSRLRCIALEEVESRVFENPSHRKECLFGAIATAAFAAAGRFLFALPWFVEVFLLVIAAAFLFRAAMVHEIRIDANEGSFTERKGFFWGVQDTRCGLRDIGPRVVAETRKVESGGRARGVVTTNVLFLDTTLGRYALASFFPDDETDQLIARFQESLGVKT